MGHVNVHFNAYFYVEMTFIILENGETSKLQEKQLFAEWRPVILKTKVETVSVQNIICRMTAEKFEYETNSTQMRFVE